MRRLKRASILSTIPTSDLERLRERSQTVVNLADQLKPFMDKFKTYSQEHIEFIQLYSELVAEATIVSRGLESYFSDFDL